MVNFVNRDTDLGIRVYAIPEGSAVPLDYEQGSLDELPGFYRKSAGKFKAVLKKPFRAEKVFDAEVDAQGWLRESIDRGY